MADARFEDGQERPLRLRALDVEDLTVISSLVQDAVLDSGDISWMPRRRRFLILLNRFRWERQGAGPERARALLTVDDVLAVHASGIDPAAKDLVLSLLSLSFQPGTDGAGDLHLILAGDGAFRLRVECVSVALTDVTRPYAAPSGKTPRHDLD
ncbi:MAG: DUF2948 family protein [Pseudomonadota bacterium]